MSSAAVIN